MILTIARAAFGAAGIAVAVVLAHGVRTCGNDGEACMGPGVLYFVLGVPAYLLGLVALIRLAFASMPSEDLKWAPRAPCSWAAWPGSTP